MSTVNYEPIGLTPNSFKNMQLNAGMFVIGMDTKDVTKDTTAKEFGEMLKTAVGEGKSLGATTGGGAFNAVPEAREIEADGKRAPIIGSTVFDSWEITLTTTIKEITKENIQRVIATASVDEETGKIRIGNTLQPSDYIPVIGWAGMLLDGRLMYVELENVLNLDGAAFTFTDKGEGSIPVTYRGHQADLENMQYAPAGMWIFDKEEEPEVPEGRSAFASPVKASTTKTTTEENKK